eukprot:CAMPEP_0180704370 /NCGR_PEP_ID=MMETSP1038_2-20121128/7113_1 /TAXON_ID=632150 /ORGANISM="Azadinium spinosum, Strain 3D9" /LENGTH=228 /DNA_ID=CAMNT_0022736185 /DNA_START=169 /DNA_END=852 /DNA_ORIENTATION=-
MIRILGDKGLERMWSIWSGYTFILGVLISFRNNQAYSRFWEGATLIQQVRGEWFNAVSSLIAFSAKDPESEKLVGHFQNVLVRLASFLYANALQQLCDMDDDSLEVIDHEGFEEGAFDFLADVNDRCEIILQWVQRLIIEGHRTGAIKVDAPILSRCFQELSRGVVNLNNVRKIKDVPFPFPYSQMITIGLIVHGVVTTLLSSQMVSTWWWAALLCFFVTTALWGLAF